LAPPLYAEREKGSTLSLATKKLKKKRFSEVKKAFPRGWDSLATTHGY
jgi:hypothetical protein